LVYRKFGDLGYDVSALGFGAMRLPEDHDEAAAVIQRSFELGVNYLDTALVYGESELKCAKALKGWRDKVLISTKNPCFKDPSVDGWRQRLDDSLTRLDVDCIDFYVIWHGINWGAWQEHIKGPGKVLEAAQKAKDEGLIKHIGYSVHDSPENVVKIVETGAFEFMIVQYNLLDRSNEEAIDKAHERGMGTVVMGPVGGGRLAGLSPELAEMVPGGVASNPEAALRFVLSNPSVSTAISGMGSMEMVEQNAKIASREDPMSAEERTRMEKALDEAQKFAKLYCTACGYCMPCPHGVDIPGNFNLMNYHRVYGLTDHAKAQYARKPTEREEGSEETKLYAGACIECGECEPKCPQDIPIMEQLKETHETLSS
jgi:hypothetical protein